MRIFCWLAILLPASCFAQGSSDALTQGVSDFKAGHYAEAVADFRKAVDADSKSVNAHLYLATALEMQFVPGSELSENLQFAHNAEAEFKKVLDLEPQNVLALASVASLYYNQKRFEEAAEWNRKVIAVDPNNKEAYYTLGVLAWTAWLPVDRQARIDSHQQPSDPGPIADAQIRAGLKGKWLPTLDEGIRDMEHALAIDPSYDDAMAYMNLLIRYRADLDATAEEWQADSARADVWMQNGLATRQGKDANVPVPPAATQPAPIAVAPRGGVAGGVVGGVIGAAPSSAPSAPTTIRQGGNVTAANVITKPDPVYPPLARAAQISGTVRFNVTIGGDGYVKQISLISGHPLLVQSARDALQQYVYKPTLLNGNPVNVRTTVDIEFSLSE